MRIECHEFAKLAPATKNMILRSVDREFGDVPIVREHIWAEPDWSILGFLNEDLVGFLNVVDRHALVDDTPIHLFGVNNVITEPPFRRQGFSTKLNREFLQFIAELDENGIGLLFCADDLIPFYERLGWKKYFGTVVVRQPNGDKNWPSNAMYYSREGSRSWKTINLCGLPW